jgi:hypothetical protein
VPGSITNSRPFAVAGAGLMAKWAERLSVSAALVSVGTISRSVEVAVGGGGGAGGGVGTTTTGELPPLSESPPQAANAKTMPNAIKRLFDLPIHIASRPLNAQFHDILRSADDLFAKHAFSVNFGNSERSLEALYSILALTQPWCKRFVRKKKENKKEG